MLYIKMKPLDHHRGNKNRVNGSPGASFSVDITNAKKSPGYTFHGKWSSALLICFILLATLLVLAEPVIVEIGSTNDRFSKTKYGSNIIGGNDMGRNDVGRNDMGQNDMGQNDDELEIQRRLKRRKQQAEESKRECCEVDATLEPMKWMSCNSKSLVEKLSQDKYCQALRCNSRSLAEKLKNDKDCPPSLTSRYDEL